MVGGAKGGQGTTTVPAAIAVFAAAHRPTRLITSDPSAAAAVLGITVPNGRALPWTPVIGQLEVATEPIRDGAFTVMDAGCIEQLPGPAVRAITVAVVRGPCDLALRSLVGAGARNLMGFVLVREPGRSLTATDVEDVTGVPVRATIDVSRIVVRTIDAGLLIARLHHLDEFTALRRWTTRQMTTNRQRPPRPKAARTAVWRLSMIGTDCPLAPRRK